jgi:hypothetical protein
MMWRVLKSGCRLNEQAYIARAIFLKCSIPYTRRILAKISDFLERVETLDLIGSPGRTRTADPAVNSLWV